MFQWLKGHLRHFMNECYNSHTSFSSLADMTHSMKKDVECEDEYKSKQQKEADKAWKRL